MGDMPVALDDDALTRHAGIVWRECRLGLTADETQATTQVYQASAISAWQSAAE